MPPPRTRKQQPQTVLRMIVDGVTYTLRVDEISALDAAALRRATGSSFAGVMRAAQEDADIDVVAALVWLARRQNGEEHLTFEAVAAELDYSTDLDFEEADAKAADLGEVNAGG